MKINSTELLKNSYALTINQRRFDLLCKTFEKCRIDPPSRIAGIRNRSICGGSCCSIGHRTIVQAAKIMDLPYVCIFEEDAYPRPDCRDYIDKALADVPDDAECVVLGWSRITKNARKQHGQYMD